MTVEKSPWTSTADKKTLPPYGKRVIIQTRWGYALEAERMRGTWRSALYSTIIDETNVLFWMEKPELPKEADKPPERKAEQTGFQQMMMEA
jgi:hypothetical protein